MEIKQNTFFKVDKYADWVKKYAYICEEKDIIWSIF